MASTAPPDPSRKPTRIAAWTREIRITREIGEVKTVILEGSRDIPIGQAPVAQG